MASTQTVITEKPELNILFQDEYIVAIDKPAGLFVHRSFLDKYEKYFAVQLLRDQIGQYVFPIHRLDKPTSGVLLFALDKQVASSLGEAFTQHNIKKEYLALVRGHISEGGTVDHPLKEKLDKIGDKFSSQNKEAQEAVTHFECLAQAELPIAVGRYSTVRYSLVKLFPQTGRRHQIRRHLAHLRHPIIGDINYGDNKQNPFFIENFGFKRLMLIAKSLSFTHPITQQVIRIETKLDQQWKTTFNTLGWQQFID